MVDCRPSRFEPVKGAGRGHRLRFVGKVPVFLPTAGRGSLFGSALFVVLVERVRQ
jgi:hypothetical protein